MERNFYLKAIIFFLIISGSLSGCFTYNSSNPVTRTSAFPKVIEKARKDSRDFFMYSGKDTFAVTSIMIANSKREFTVQLDRLDSSRRANLNNPANQPEKQLALYMLDSTSYTLDEPHTIALKKIARIQLRD